MVRAILLVALALCSGACAAVTRSEYFAVRSGSDRTEHSWPGDVHYLYSGRKPDVAIVERGGVQLRMTVEDDGEDPILVGLILPIVPVFMIQEWKTPLRAESLTVRLDVGGIRPSRPARIRFHQIRLRTTSPRGTQAPDRVRGLGKHGHVECPEREADLPSDRFAAFGLPPRPSLFSLHRHRERFYSFRMEYRPGVVRLDSLEFELGGVIMGNEELEPARVTFSRRRDWLWLMSGP